MAFKSRIDPLTNRSRYTIAFRSQMSHVAPDIPLKKRKKKNMWKGVNRFYNSGN